MSDSLPKLNYDLPPPRVNPRQKQRYLIFLAALFAVQLIVIVAPIVSRRATQFRLQRPCLSYTAPETQVVYDEEPAMVARLLASGPDYVAVAPPTQPGVKGVAYVPGCWRQFDRAYSAGLGTPEAVLFLHELRTPSGMRRLVHVSYGWRIGSRIAINTDSYDPALSWRRSPQVVSARPSLNASSARGLLRFYAGQVDPADPSRFVVIYDVDGAKGTITGQLQNAGNVTITIESGPLKPG